MANIWLDGWTLTQRVYMIMDQTSHHTTPRHKENINMKRREEKKNNWLIAQCIRRSLRTIYSRRVYTSVRRRINKRRWVWPVHLQNEFESYGKFANHKCTLRKFPIPASRRYERRYRPFVRPSIRSGTLRKCIYMMWIATKNVNWLVALAKQTKTTKSIQT